MSGAATGAATATLPGPGAATPRRPRPRTRWAAGTARQKLVQVIAVALVAALLGFVAWNVAANVGRLRIGTGFGFLSRPAGFEIAQVLLPYTPASTYLAAFWVALVNTVVLAAVSIVLATAIGLAVALARLSHNPLVAGLARAFVETVRNLPLLLHLLFWYFAVIRSLPPPRSSLSVSSLAYLNNRGLFLTMPEVDAGLARVLAACAAGCAAAAATVLLARARRRRTGRAPFPARLAILPPLLLPALVLVAGLGPAWSVPKLTGFAFRGGLEVIPEFVAMAIGLSVYSGAFVAEIFRGGIGAVPAGQREAGLALGLPPWQVTRLIVVPQALRAIVPPLGAQYVLLVKNSSLAAAIGYPDLMLIFAGTVLNQTGQPLEVMAMTLAAYLTLGLVIAAAFGLWNARLRIAA